MTLGKIIGNYIIANSKVLLLSKRTYYVTVVHLFRLQPVTASVTVIAEITHFHSLNAKGKLNIIK